MKKSHQQVFIRFLLLHFFVYIWKESQVVSVYKEVRRSDCGVCLIVEIELNGFFGWKEFRYCIFQDNLTKPRFGKPQTTFKSRKIPQ